MILCCELCGTFTDESREAMITHKQETCPYRDKDIGTLKQLGRPVLIYRVKNGKFTMECKLYHSTVEPLLSDPLDGVTVRLNNRKAKVTGSNGVGRVVSRSDN